MQKNKADKTFTEEYEQRSTLKAINEYSWFGIIWGLALGLLGAYQAICTAGIISIIFKAVSVVGVVLLAVGVMAPLWLRKPAEIIKKAFSAVGNIILKVVLLPVYMVMAVVNLLNNKKYSSKCGFKNWEERDSAQTAYSDFNNSGESKYKHTVTGTFVKVIGFFVNNKMYVVVPIVIILLFVGFVMFFASSSAVFSFVYTLF
mgnify:CR=1 FL=1